jgi:hypothetical protein
MGDSTLPGSRPSGGEATQRSVQPRRRTLPVGGEGSGTMLSLEYNEAAVTLG